MTFTYIRAHYNHKIFTKIVVLLKLNFSFNFPLCLPIFIFYKFLSRVHLLWCKVCFLKPQKKLWFQDVASRYSEAHTSWGTLWYFLMFYKFHYFHFLLLEKHVKVWKVSFWWIFHSKSYVFSPLLTFVYDDELSTNY